MGHFTLNGQRRRQGLKARRSSQRPAMGSLGAEKPSPGEGPHRVALESLPPPAKRDTEVRAWLVVSSSGLSYVTELGKHAMKRRTGLPARALRTLDPMLSQPMAVVGRGRAIAVNLECVRVVITPAEVLVLHAKDPVVAPFVEELRRRVTESYKMQNLVQESSVSAIEAPEKVKLGSQLVPASVGVSRQFEISSEKSAQFGEIERGNPWTSFGMTKSWVSDSLPFEFSVLEVCLEYVCRSLECEATTLECEAYPTLDELETKINTLNLEHVRQIKSRLSSITTRVEKVKDELQRILDSDMDMAELYLTDKLLHQQQEGSSDNESDDNESDDDDNIELHGQRKKNMSSEERKFSDHFKPDIQKLEMLIETYLTETKGTLDKLFALRDYIDDTEDYIRITLGEKQNKLLQLQLMVSTAVLLVHMGVLTVGVFAINVNIPFFNSGTTQLIEIGTGVPGCIIALYLLAILIYKKTGVLLW